ncbi:RNA polymerase sigma factor [Reichenbachiella carrageenanivorans]|uniref:RNA polymerase sigma factor n=1 Tax=Reichenbachiella carrageenanivorans TaxID=2979869 RepID=A0ABY6CZS1_9BACT|nr:RNA polymerase sigma factor [Reichenbachiella carrageenanivorans]UXX79194.1 RNA polymerase sigma factor [Reichenbachiella carrageenanivorans]
MIQENEWLEQMASGSDEALVWFYNQYATKVYNTIISYTKNAEDAEEVLQDVFVTLFNTAAKFKHEASVSTWIYRIAVNKSLDFLRKKNSAKRMGVFSSLYKKGSNETIIEPVDFVHPGVTLENSEDAKLLFRVIDRLSDNQKTAFILTQIEGLPQQEVADIMKITRKSVESLLQRAKANLRIALENYYPERGKTSKNTSS